MKLNCLWYALDRWHSEGGALVLVASRHWCIPHVQYRDNQGVLTEYRPYSDLPAPCWSLFGFDGYVHEVDASDHRAPQHALCTLVGTLLLLVMGGAWGVHRLAARRPRWR